MQKLDKDPYVNNQWYLERFLVARKYKLKDSIIMLEDHLDFRAKNLKNI